MFLSLSNNDGDNNKGMYIELDAGNQAEVEVALLAMKEFFATNSCGGCAECGHTQKQTDTNAEQKDVLEGLQELSRREPLEKYSKAEIGALTEQAYCVSKNPEFCERKGE